MGCSQSRQPVAPVATRTSSRGPEPVESAGPGLIKKPSRGVLLQRVPSKQLFSESKQHPITQSVGRSQKRGSVTKAHGMSFTEVRAHSQHVCGRRARRLCWRCRGGWASGAAAHVFTRPVLQYQCKHVPARLAVCALRCPREHDS